MSDNRPEQIRQPDQPAVSSLLAQAFADDPVYQYFLKGIAPDKTELLRQRLVAFIVAYHCRAGMAVWGVRHHDKWVCYALVETPTPWWRRLFALILHMPGLLCRVPWVCIWRMNQYARVSRSGVPSSVHYFLVKIGVAPELQGQGCGKRLITALQQHYRAVTDVIALDTENPANIPLYEHLGFELCDQQQLEELVIYRMRCPLK